MLNAQGAPWGGEGGRSGRKRSRSLSEKEHVGGLHRMVWIAQQFMSTSLSAFKAGIQRHYART